MNNLERAYRERLREALCPIAKELRNELEELFSNVERIDRISVRPKSLRSFLKKSENLDEEGNQKYSQPFVQIQDQIGVRVVTFYTDDIECVKNLVLKEFRAIEEKKYVPDTEKEFGYTGRHFILKVPKSVCPENIRDELIPDFFELQIKTLFQHAWAEANHDLDYKPSNPLDSEQKRKIAFTAAQAWGADMIFNDLHNELRFDTKEE